MTGQILIYEFMKEKKMENKRFWIEILKIVFFSGFVGIGSLHAQTDTRLNGRWVSIGYEIETEYIFNDGNFESTINGISMQRGTYTTNSGEIIIYETHIFGGSLDILGISGLESKWYSINEFIIAFRRILTEYGFSQNQIDETVNQMTATPSSTYTYTYSVDANTLILSPTGNNQLIIFSKKD